MDTQVYNKTLMDLISSINRMWIIFCESTKTGDPRTERYLEEKDRAHRLIAELSKEAEKDARNLY